MQPYPLLRRLYAPVLRNRSFSILSDNCWGGFMSRYLGLGYRSPFVGLFVFSPDYIRLLENLEAVYADLRFIRPGRSKYAASLAPGAAYPIATVGDDIELHFLHYASEAEAARKWRRRLGRLDPENLIVKFCDRDRCTPELIARFDRLPYRQKVCFTARPYPGLASVRFVRCQRRRDCVENCWKVSQRYWDIVAAANALAGHPAPRGTDALRLWLAARLTAF